LTDTAVLSVATVRPAQLLHAGTTANTGDTETVAVVNGDGSYTTPRATPCRDGHRDGCIPVEADVLRDANNASSADNNNARQWW